MKHLARTRLWLWTIVSFLCCQGSFAAVPARDALELEIPYTTFKLSNGLTVIVHEDHKAPVVAVHVWYGVGSSSEPAGKTGYAHLFEHVMFNGSEHFDGDRHGPLTDVGATDVNGATSFDWTHYHQTVPTSALDRVLWMESDRMIYLLGALDQGKLDEQRAVVKNEKRQGDNAPYGLLSYAQLAGLFPSEHPYHHPPIGSLEDLDQATLADVREWFSTHYGAADVILSIAGDVTIAEMKEKVGRYFGAALPGNRRTLLRAAVPYRPRSTYEVMQDRVPQRRIVRSWAVPGWAAEEAAALDLAASILGSGKNSRLHKTLVHERQFATSASATLQEFGLAGMFVVDVMVKPDVDSKAAAAALDEVLAELLSAGPASGELERAKVRVRAGRVRPMEQVSMKAAILAESQLHGGSPHAWRVKHTKQQTLTAKQIKNVAREWLSNGFHQITINPAEQYTAEPDAVDRTTGLPAVSSVSALVWPRAERAQLSNGLPVIFMQRESVPLISVALLFDAGSSAEAATGDGKAGLASLTMQALSEGAAGKDALRIAAEIEDMGSSFRSQSRRDESFVFYAALTTKFAATTARVADIVRRPDFPEEALQRLKQQLSAATAQAKASPHGIAGRITAELLYGAAHPYGSRSVMSEETLAKLSRTDVQNFAQAWIRPDNATLVVVGNGTLAGVLPILDRSFGDWHPAAVPKGIKNFPPAARPSSSRVIIVDRPSSPQAFIQASVLQQPLAIGHEPAIDVLNEVIGGSFSSRLNMNLREQKGWSYGAGSSVDLTARQRVFSVSTSVEIEKTAAAMSEIKRELSEISSSHPVTQEELERAIFNRVRTMPGRFETTAALMDSLVTSRMLQRPFDHPVRERSIYESLRVEDVRLIVPQVLDVNALAWVVVGDLEKIEPSIRALGFGTVEVRTAH